MQEHKNK